MKLFDISTLGRLDGESWEFGMTFPQRNTEVCFKYWSPSTSRSRGVYGGFAAPSPVPGEAVPLHPDSFAALCEPPDCPVKILKLPFEN